MSNQGPGGGPPTRQQQPESKTEGFGLTTTSKSGETAGMVVAEQAKAEIQARRFLAIQFPRDIADVRQKLVKECERPGFADAAIYHKPIGKGIEGLSVRFAESALRCMGNLGISAYSIFDDSYKRIIRQSVEDYENNLVYSLDITLDKTIERRDATGREVIGHRLNKQGEMVYIVAATEDELLNKERAQISKAIRTNGLRHLPGDIADECKQLCYFTMEKKDAQDPDAARKKLFDMFAAQNVMPSQLKDYLAHEVGTASVAEMRELRGVLMVLRDGEMSWKEIIDAKNESRKSPDEGGDQKKAEGLKAKLAAQEDKEKQKKAAAAAGTTGAAGAGPTDTKAGEPPKAEGKAAKAKPPEGQGSLPVDDKKNEPPDADKDGR